MQDLRERLSQSLGSKVCFFFFFSRGNPRKSIVSLSAEKAVELMV